jgi:hypothetical protein
VFLFGSPVFGEVLFREVTEGAVGVFRGVIIFPGFVVFVVVSSEEALELVFT